MRLVERRIGLLFASSWLLLGVAAAARHLARHRRGGRARERAAHAAGRGAHGLRPPGHDHRPQRASSWRSPRTRSRCSRNPFLIDDPARVAAKLAPLSGRPRTSCWRSSPTAKPGSSTCAQAGRVARREGRGARRSRGSARSSSPSAPIRRARWPSQVLGQRRHRQLRPLRARAVARRGPLRGTDGQAPARQGRARRAGEHRRGRARRARRGPPPHDRRRDPGAHRGGARPRSGQTYRPQGATAVVMDPRNGAGARAGELAAGGRERPRRRPRRTRRQNRAVAGQLRAGLDLQGVHRGRRAGGEPDRARDRPSTVPPDDPGGRPRDRRGARRAAAARFSVADILAQSSNVGSVMIGLKLGARALRQAGCAASGSGSRPGAHLPGEEQRHRAEARGLLGLVDGQPADRPGPRGHAHADGRRLLGDRRTAASCAGRTSWPATAPVPRRVLSQRTAERVSTMLEGVLAAGRHRAGGAGRGLHPRRQDRHGREGDRRRLLEDQVRGVVHRLRACAGPAAAGGGDGRRAREATSTAAPSRRRRSSGSWSSRCPT